MNTTLVISSETSATLLWVAVILLLDFFAVMVATVVDLVSALRKAARMGVKRTSRGYRRTVDKLLRYFLTLIALSAVDLLLVISMLSLRSTMGWHLPVFPLFTTVGAVAMTLIEAKSVMENAHKKSDLTSMAEAAAELLSDPSLKSLLEVLRSLRDRLPDPRTPT